MITFKKYELVAPDGFGKWESLYELITWDNLELALRGFEKVKMQMRINGRYLHLELREVEYEAVDDGDNIQISNKLVCAVDMTRVPVGGYITEIN
jgi:hypothetical protein